jgi:hypothetical protein
MSKGKNPEGILAKDVGNIVGKGPHIYPAITGGAET